MVFVYFTNLFRRFSYVLFKAVSIKSPIPQARCVLKPSHFNPIVYLYHNQKPYGKPWLKVFQKL